MTEAPDLLPCPFCGGPAEIWRAHEDRPAWIACMGKCSVLVSNAYKTTEEAITAWNTRATGWRDISSAPNYKHGFPILCRNENHWPEICYVKGGMAFDHRGLAMVGYVPVEWNAAIGRLNWLNAPLPTPPGETP